MFSIIVAFPKIEDAKNIKNILIRQGYDVAFACSSGAQALAKANELDGGIIICGYRLPDMYYADVYEYLPKGFELLLIASLQKLESCMNNNIVCLGMPLKGNELRSTLDMMLYKYNRRKKKEKPKQRSLEEKQVIEKAKSVLMERNNMTEEEAHRYIQKTSMDNGVNMLETAQMILAMM